MKWAALLVLLAPAAAWADPISVGAALQAAWSLIVNITVVQALGIASVASTVFGAAKQRRKARAAAARQKAEYNASLEDRSVTLLQANPPLRVVYGRGVVGGDIVAMFTSSKTGVRENGSTYTKADALKHLVIVVAAHEVQAIHDVFIDGVSIGPLDGNGWVTSGEFFVSNKPVTRQATIGGSGYVDISPAALAIVGTGALIVDNGVDTTYTTFTPTLSLGNTRISGTVGGIVTYTVANPSPASVRVSKFLGTASQAVDTYLNSVKPTEWTSNHRLRGLAGVVVTLDLEEPRFQAGPPQITFDVSGRKVLDTRTSTTAWTENPALITRDFLTQPWGLGVAAADIDTAACNAAANACDARQLAATHSHATTFTADASADEISCAADRWFSTGDGVRLTTTTTLPGGLATATTYYVIANASRRVFKLASSLANARAGTAINITSAGTGTHTVTWYDYAAYTCNGAFATDGSGKESILEDLVETMAGTATYGATWVINAGAWAASVMSLVDDDLDGQIEIVQAGAGLDAIFNGVRGQFIPAGKSTPVDMDPYQNATFVTADGQELWSDVALPFVGNKVRAANLARIQVEQARDGLVIRYPAKLKAWPLQVGDRVAVTSAEYAWTAKTFRVTDWQFGATTAVVLTLQEDIAAIYNLADAVSADPAPNTGLPSPWIVAAPANVAAASGTTHLVRRGDGTIVSRVLVSWDAITDPYLTEAGGYVYVSWRGPSGPWATARTTGDLSSLYINGVRDGTPLTIAVWAENALGGKSPRVHISHTVVGKAQAPANVAGLTATKIAGAVRLTWTQCADIDYASTELRVGGSDWATASPLVGTSLRIKGTEFVWAWPAAAAYTIRAKHRDTSGNESATAATAAVTITQNDLALLPTQFTGGGNLLKNSSFEVDSNADGVPDYWTGSSIGTGLTVTPSQSTNATHGRWSFRLQISGITAPTSQATHQYFQTLDATILPKVQPGQRYVCSAEFLPGHLDYSARISVFWYDAALTLLSSTNENTALASTTAWTRVWSSVLTAPAGAAFARVGLGLARPSVNSTTSTSMRIDAAMFMTAESAAGYWPADSATGDLLPGSATEAVSAFDEVETVAGLTASYDMDLCTASYVNLGERAVQLFIEGSQETKITVTAGTGTVRGQTFWGVNSSLGSPPLPVAAFASETVTDVVGVGSKTALFSHGWTVVVPPGDDVEVFLRFETGELSGSATWTVLARNTSVRILVLKT